MTLPQTSVIHLKIIPSTPMCCSTVIENHCIRWKPLYIRIPSILFYSCKLARNLAHLKLQLPSYTKLRAIFQCEPPRANVQSSSSLANVNESAMSSITLWPLQLKTSFLYNDNSNFTLNQGLPCSSLFELRKIKSGKKMKRVIKSHLLVAGYLWANFSSIDVCTFNTLAINRVLCSQVPRFFLSNWA